MRRSGLLQQVEEPGGLAAPAGDLGLGGIRLRAALGLGFGWAPSAMAGAAPVSSVVNVVILISPLAVITAVTTWITPVGRNCKSILRKSCEAMGRLDPEEHRSAGSGLSAFLRGALGARQERLRGELRTGSSR